MVVPDGNQRQDGVTHATVAAGAAGAPEPVQGEQGRLCGITQPPLY